MTEHRTPVRILASESAAKVIRSELSRRRFLTFAAAAGATGLLAACSPGGGTAGRLLRVERSSYGCVAAQVDQGTMKPVAAFSRA